MRMLIVDDDSFGRNMMKGLAEEIAECVVAKSGSGGLTAFKKAREKCVSFDLISLDINMPDISGKEVLKMIREYEKIKKVPAEERVKILMATAHTDKTTIINCLREGCNDYITKPYKKNILYKKLEKLGFDIDKEMKKRNAMKDEDEAQGKIISSGTIKELIGKIIKNYESSSVDLPTLPKIVTEIHDLINNASAGLDTLAKVIEQDLAISEKLLSVSNTAFYRVTENIGSVQKAISRLGVKETENIVLAIANKGIYHTSNLHLDKFFEKLWSHSLACAYAARSLANKIGEEDIEKYFFMGLIHDIGKPLILRRLIESKNLKMDIDMEDLIPAIQEVHTTFGTICLKQWGFRKDFIRVARRHEADNPREDTPTYILVINLANKICRFTGHSLFEDDTHPEDSRSAQLLKLDREALDAVADEVETLMSETSGTF